MTASLLSEQPLSQLLDESERPVYALDAHRRIVYCNPALEAWLGLEADRIVGRYVEYHSEPEDDSDAAANALGPLAGLCPPPQALAGNLSAGTVSCVARDGRLVHRRADFVPLASSPGGVLTLLAPADLSPQELSAGLSGGTSADELHQAIHRFRRSQAGRYAIESLLGDSPVMEKVRSQVTAAAASGANVLICGPPGAGRAHIARAIHYRASGDSPAKLVPVDCELVTEDRLRRALDSVRSTASDADHRPSLLFEQIDRLSPAHQSFLLEAIRRGVVAARILATSHSQPDASDSLDPAFINAVSTITIRAPKLIDRLEDLPILVQSLLESCNRDSTKQVGSMRPEALDRLALYSWPGELDELREVVVAAHRAAESHEIGPDDLPAVVHHAANKAALPLRPKERIVLDELLATIEKEAIVRAMAQARGNKTAAADLLGLTRPRLYRRLEQLGLAPEPPSKPKAREVAKELPDFQELDPEEPDS